MWRALPRVRGADRVRVPVTAVDAPQRLRALITTPLEAELVEGLRQRHRAVDFILPESLLAPARFPAHHPFATVADHPEREREWNALLDTADILVDFGPVELQSRLRARPRLRWIQTTSSGVGELVQRVGLADSDLPVITTASGVHAGPLAEFALLGMLWCAKRVSHLLDQQRAHRWERSATTELAGRVVVVVGMGRVGTAVAGACAALGMRVVGCTRRPRAGAGSPAEPIVPVEELDAWLPRADFLVISCPLTAATHHLIDAARLARLPQGAVLINVGRGPCVVESALIASLRDGHLGGAVLDVVEHEPLAPDSPLWDLPQVLLSPHSASTVASENSRIVAIFDDNLGRFQRGEPLRNRLDKHAGY